MQHLQLNRVLPDTRLVNLTVRIENKAALQELTAARIRRIYNNSFGFVRFELSTSPIESSFDLCALVFPNANCRPQILLLRGSANSKVNHGNPNKFGNSFHRTNESIRILK